MRDDFTRQTIAEIAKAVGYRCSNPECARPTVGANAAQDGIIGIGVAAHICAASPGGPRYNPAQSREARRGKDNGIWLCQTCGRLVDADPERFAVEVLAGWKRDAQTRAFREVVAPGVPAATEEVIRIGSIVVADNRSGTEAGFDALRAKVRAAAGADLAGYKQAPIWSHEAVELTLRLYDDQAAPSFSISKLPLAVELAPEVTIVAPPGTGKTTTLLQLAGHALADNSIVPVYFSLGDWAAGTQGLLANVHQRPAFKNVAPDEFLRLAAHGRILLLLDGWNELDAASRKRLRREVEHVRRQCPSIRIVATTRRQMLDVPLAGPRISIDPLSDDQEMAIARTQFGATGEKIVDEAWRTPGIRELITIPLYLSALLSGRLQGARPATKEEVLRLFVQQHERAGDHAEVLQEVLSGCHANLMIALASQMNATGSAAITETEARRTITLTLTQLRQAGQILSQPEPIAVLEALTNHHTLTRTSSGTIAFQHQQLQEWFASYDVETLVRSSAGGDSGAQVRLRAAVLDQPACEESILFGAERLSREHGGATIIAHAVRLALPIDPMLAAEMIFRSSPAVWEIVSAEMIAFVNRWHAPGTVDRAVRFMIMTGRPEFEPLVWPLASSSNTQVQLPTLRTAPRFRPAVLGADLGPKIAALPEKTREHLLALIASESGVDGMDLATELAKADPSPKLQAEVVQYLQFRGADRHVASLLAGAHDETWALVASRGYAKEIKDSGAAARLRRERERVLAEASDPHQRLRLLLEQPPTYPERDAGVIAAIADPRFPVRDQHGGASLYYTQERAPAAVLEGLRRRLEAGLELPFHAEDFLNQLSVIDDGPVAKAILDVSEDDRRGHSIAIVAGPLTVTRLLDTFLDCARARGADPNDRTLAERYLRLRDRILATRPPSFVTALIARADTDDPDAIASLASLIASHGDSDDRKSSISVNPEQKIQLIAILRRWTDTVIASPTSKRGQLNEIANAIGRFGFGELVSELHRLLAEDLARLKRAQDGFADALRRGDIRATSDAQMRYGNQYREAFARIGGDEAAAVASAYLEDRVFGFDAALILKAVSDKQLNVPEPDFRRHWPWLDEIPAARAARAASPKALAANALAAPIFAAIDRLARPEIDQQGQLLAIQLTRVALAMPHPNQDALTERVMALPQPTRSKRELFAAVALDGQVLDADVVMRAIDEWLADAVNNAWHNRQNTWEIQPWLELLPFTSRPDAVIEGLAKVKAFYEAGWAQRWERVLAAVAAVPGSQGEALLATLARAHKDIAGDFEWMKAVLGRDSPSATLLYVDLYSEGVFGDGPHPVDPWHAGQELAVYARKFPELKPELKRRYEAAQLGRAGTMLEYFFGEVGEGDDLIAMVKKNAANNQTYDGRMSAAIRAAALRREPVEAGSNSYYIHPAPVAQVRKSLFDLLSGTAQEAALAKRCLVAIDVLRDEYGIASGDTRHPDVMSETAWPQEAG